MVKLINNYFLEGINIMKIGLPQGLLYYRYYPFFQTFFEKIGAELITSQATNKQILDTGINSCTSEACLPIKIFHGHVETIKKQCDLILIPRIMKVHNDEYICPHLCSLPEMIIHSLSDMPPVIYQSIYFNSRKKLHFWAREVGKQVTNQKALIDNAFLSALICQMNYKKHINQHQFKYKVLLLGHEYNIYDSYVNMNLIKKLNDLDIGVISSDSIEEKLLNDYTQRLPRKPFWNFYRQAYGSASYLSSKKAIHGIIFISCFGCGIDSIISEIIEEDVNHIPLLSLKLDEHTADAGMDTRIEAFSDMIKLKYLKGAALW